MKPGQLRGALRLRFPGLFNECWLYVNGREVAHRAQNAIWWRNSYKFEWDVDLTGRLTAGRNTFALRIPGREKYLAALDQAVAAAVRGDQSPAAALAEAARQWHEITKELGLENQKAAYLQSLGLEP